MGDVYAVLNRAKAFLPLLADSNATLLARAAIDPKAVDIEHTAGEERVIAMVRLPRSSSTPRRDTSWEWDGLMKDHRISGWGCLMRRVLEVIWGRLLRVGGGRGKGGDWGL